MNDQLLRQILAEVQNVKSEVENVKSELGKVKTEVESVKDELQTVKSQLNSRFDSLETRMSSSEEKMSSMEANFMEVKDKLKVIEGQTACLSESHHETNVKLDRLIESQRSIHEILGEHEVSIRTLRRKPV